MQVAAPIPIKHEEEEAEAAKAAAAAIDDNNNNNNNKPSAEEASYRLTEERKDRLERIGFVWNVREKDSSRSYSGRNSYDDQWDAMFERLRGFKAKNGNCLVPKRHKEDPKLGTWVDTQRVQYKKMMKQLAEAGLKIEDVISVPGKGDMDTNAADKNPKTLAGKALIGRLTEERILRLEDLGFVWSLRDDWQKHYEELIEFKSEHGHCNVPARYQQNRRLGIWVSAQRQQFKLMNQHDENKPRRSAPLTMERVKLLNQLGFTWTIRSRDSLGESWNQKLEELRQYKKEHNDCLVPSRYPPNPELGVWVGTQRTQYRLYMRAKENGQPFPNPSAMNEQRIAQLEELNFTWALRGSSDNIWKKRISELIHYKGMHGDCEVPLEYKANPKLGAFVANQRAQYILLRENKPSTLDAEKVEELESLGINWEGETKLATELDASLDELEADQMGVVSAATEAAAVQMAGALAAAAGTIDGSLSVDIPAGMIIDSVPHHHDGTVAGLIHPDHLAVGAEAAQVAAEALGEAEVDGTDIDMNVAAGILHGDGSIMNTPHSSTI